MNKEIEDCLALNKSLKEHNLVKLTWGNASVLSEDGKPCLSVGYKAYPIRGYY